MVKFKKILKKNYYFKKIEWRLCNAGCLKEQNFNCTCTWSEWTQWSICTKSCNGTQSRYRNCNSLTDSQTMSCGTQCNPTCSRNQKTYQLNQIIYQDMCTIE